MTTGTEVAVRRPQGQAAAIPAKLAYARALADSGLLPAAYRRNPANVLWAVEYGEMLGLPPMAAMTGVHVIEGKPTASAGLISGLVRQAGHKLRVWGSSKSATCEIIRSDDPEHTFSVTWTLKRNADDHPSAEEADLLGKKVWKQYPASMLKSRAITQCARDACEEVLYGLHYTAEELGAEVDEDGVVVAEVVDEPAQQLAARSAGTPQDDEWYVHPAPETTADQEWLAATLRIIPEIGLDACRKLWPETREKVRAGEVAKPDGQKVLDLLKARMEALANPPQAAAEAPAGTEAAPSVAAVLDPEDPWALKIEELGDEDDATAALDEVAEMVGSGAMQAEHADLIETAIAARFPRAAGRAVAA